MKNCILYDDYCKWINTIVGVAKLFANEFFL